MMVNTDGLQYDQTSAVPVERETLKWGRDNGRTDDTGRTDVKVEKFMQMYFYSNQTVGGT